MVVIYRILKFSHSEKELTVKGIALEKENVVTGPPTQATGPPRSGEGVGDGVLSGTGNSLT